MTETLRSVANAVVIRDDRYGNVYELVTPATAGSRNVGLAYVEVDVGAESPAHYHERTEEVYYIIRGAGSMSLDGREIQLRPGDAVYIPVGVRHSIRNEGAEPLCFISADSPPYDPEDDIEV